MFDFIEKLLAGLVPPDSGGDVRVRRWRLWIAGVTAMNAIGLTAHILLACGYLPFYPGFLQAGEIAKMQAQAATDAQAVKSQLAAIDMQVQVRLGSIESDQKARRISALKKDILDLQLKRCTTPAGPAKALYTASIQDMMLEYNTLTGVVYPLPGCDSF